MTLSGPAQTPAEKIWLTSCLQTRYNPQVAGDFSPGGIKMVIILTAFLAAAQSLPIDRTALELQSRAEALQPRARTTAPARVQPGPRKPVTEPERSAAVRPGPSRPTQVA